MAQTRLPERWKIVSRNSLYEVSDRGRVRSNAGGKTAYLLRPGRCASGHLTVLLGGGVGSTYVHILIAEAFLPQKPAVGHEVRHIDGNPANNEYTNLDWSTRGRNNQDKKHHAGATGRLTIEEVKTIKRSLRHGTPGVVLAARFGVGQSAISAIKHGRNHPEVEI